MLLKILRTSTGYLVIFLDWVTRGKAITRSTEDQERVNSTLKGLSIYQHQACPFCTKTRRALYKLGTNIEFRDIKKTASYRDQLEAGGGRVKVPCLRIEEGDNVQWMYESSDIIDFISDRVRKVV